jgi:hypothetical protein
MPVTPANTGTVFARLDQDWTITCRRTRRTDTLARWTAQEPALGDLARLEDIAAPRKTIPAAHFGAILRLTIAGDTTAARTLLQMIRPGLVRITRELRSPHHTHLAGDVVTAAWACIHRVQHGIVTVHTASCLLRSIRRDTRRARLDLHHDHDPDTGTTDYTNAPPRSTTPRPGTRSGATHLSVVAAETTALAGPLARVTLDTAVADGTLTRTAADIVWLTSVHEQPVPAVAAATGTSVSTAYALRATAHARLRGYYTAA